MRRIMVTGAAGPPATNFVRLVAHGARARSPDRDRRRQVLPAASGDVLAVPVPPAPDPSFLKLLNNIVERERVELVHAQNDTEVAFISEHRDRLGARVFLSAPENVRTCLNKVPLVPTRARGGAEGTPIRCLSARRTT
jgi:hypothetical protein